MTVGEPCRGVLFELKIQSTEFPTIPTNDEVLNN